MLREVMMSVPISQRNIIFLFFSKENPIQNFQKFFFTKRAKMVSMKVQNPLEKIL